MRRLLTRPCRDVRVIIGEIALQVGTQGIEQRHGIALPRVRVQDESDRHVSLMSIGGLAYDLMGLAAYRCGLE